MMLERSDESANAPRHPRVCRTAFVHGAPSEPFRVVSYSTKI